MEGEEAAALRGTAPPVGRRYKPGCLFCGLALWFSCAGLLRGEVIRAIRVMGWDGVFKFIPMLPKVWVKADGGGKSFFEDDDLSVSTTYVGFIWSLLSYFVDMLYRCSLSRKRAGFGGCRMYEYPNHTRRTCCTCIGVDGSLAPHDPRNKPFHACI